MSAQDQTDHDNQQAEPAEVTRPAAVSAVWSAPTPPDLLVLKEQVFDPLGIVCTGLTPEAAAEGAEYAAHKVRLDGAPVRLRSARKTPEKNGLFVTLWLRRPTGTIRPFAVGDKVRLFVVTAREDDHFGHFVFPAGVLARQRILSSPDADGKRAFRVYPPWSAPHNAQAARTRGWQREFFLPLDSATGVDLERARQLYAPAITGS
ncbi:MepB family protein [Kineosporia sp. NBRC 101731]|uniref:MepB family protein n=1 Tax=Kineosporia sp. NBRC 101731 TaxID=3032199 RepID=UPI0024A5703B|nr:MepB family protein [Kineosporia sp. NBRC 101731]GLY30132.1 hypothetical protein Kisp02_34970 [Kineosporia sp. NBRC 101731]